ncbi:anaerobic carbon-monoxide dehydrogenase catalytic subunit [Carboxydocella sp. ULO1]|uniref:anaerobic carbon-monoxide dehydrogenase catalytic subunit n=1 Tax=Carboxydocella sp. ULO1 TaxID=1926599 RepID=UPI0009ADFBEF|nr:anaerobic carbon-monoxide dehydrogenase catalytic subunit [Carboxydocella sp. ULO1]GAW28677.1 carbon-monoxide dehydrogenase catalytic subunit [Carboxydocella sp. ULO1]
MGIFDFLLGGNKQNHKESHGCASCAAADSCYSAHESVNQLQERMNQLGLPSVFDRYQAQQPQCDFGKKGICCQLCSHGPCRITPKAPYGICGATADTIVARNLARLTVHGVSAYTHHLEELCKTLKATAEGKTPFTIGDPDKLKALAQVLGLEPEQPVNELAKAVADIVLVELRKGADEPLALVKLFAPPTRIQAWEKLGIVPGGPLSEVRDALTKTMSNITSDPVDLLLTTLRLGIAAGYMGLVATITLQDILLGSPKLVKSAADLGILDPDTVNIVAHGHVPLMATAVIEAVNDPELIKLAEAAGAKGIKVYGSMCTGQELMQRNAHNRSGYAGQLGNWITQEFMIATGAVDLVMMDMNCSIPALKYVADRFHTKLISVSHILRMAGVETNIDYKPEKVAEQAREIVKMAIAAYKNRGKDVVIPVNQKPVVAGFGLESIASALGGSLNPLLDAIKSGAIKGVVAVVGCTNNRNGHDSMGIALTKELIKRDILVINSGCMSSATENAGLMDPAAAELAGSGLKAVCQSLGIPPALNFGSCVDIGRIGVVVTELANALGVDPSQLPVAASAPEYLEQKAVADGAFAVAFGLLTHLAPAPPVLGSELVTRILTKDVEDLTGGRFLVELDPVKAADAIEAHILKKRQALGI